MIRATHRQLAVPRMKHLPLHTWMAVCCFLGLVIPARLFADQRPAGRSDAEPLPTEAACIETADVSVPTADRQASVPDAVPNILVCIADDWGLHAGVYGTNWVKTPNFDRVAEQGILFLRAYTPNAKCAPSRACLLTGRNSWQLREAANHICHFPHEFRAWPEALAENGWTTGHTQKGWGPGVAVDADGNPRKMTGPAYNQRQLASPPTAAISRTDYAANFVDFLNQAPAGKPWCFWFGALEPHRGYEFGSGIQKGGKALHDIDRVPEFWPDCDEVRHDMLDYAFEVEHFDQHVGAMLDELERRGELRNTLVIVTSDHGPPFPRSKGNANEFANHVPLAMMWPEGIRNPGRTIADFVSFVDIAPTLLQLARLTDDQHGLAPVTGRSLLPMFQSEHSGQIDTSRDHVLIGKERTDVGRPHDWGYPIRGIVTSDWLFVQNFEPSRWPAGNPETGYLDCDGGMTKTVILRNHRRDPGDVFWQLCFGLRPAEELYHLDTDPDCVRNLAEPSDSVVPGLTTDTIQEARAALRERLHARLTEEGDPRMRGEGKVFDEYEHANKSHVNFYEKFLRGDNVRAGWIDVTDIDPLPNPPSNRR